MWNMFLIIEMNLLLFEANYPYPLTKWFDIFR